MKKLYYHPRCSTCKKAIAYLKKANVDYQAIDLTEKGPTKAELSKMLGYLNGSKRIFNTSGKKYRELNLKDRRETMTKNEVLTLLASEPMLIKRPFALFNDSGIVGFKESEWKTFLSN